MAQMFNAGQLDVSGHPPLSAFDYPVSRGLSSSVMLTSGREVAEINFKTGEKGQNIHGTPIWQDGYATLGTNIGYVTTDVLETLAMSFVVVARIQNPSSPMIGNYEGGSKLGMALYSPSSAANQVSINVGTIDGNKGYVQQNVEVGRWHLYIASVSAAGNVTLRVPTRGSVLTPSGVFAREIKTASPITIGHLASNGFSSQIDIALTQTFNVELSEVESESIYIWAKNVMREHGIEI